MALPYATHHTKPPDWDRKRELIDTFSIGSFLVSSKILAPLVVLAIAQGFFDDST